jgi:beta-lactamase class D
MTVSGAALTREMTARDDLMDVFERAQVIGAFVTFDVRPNHFTFVHAARAESRYSPASTFKIPNTLIALETGRVESAEEMFRYDGKPRRVKAWERDMTLREAMATSNVTVYQEIARRIGLSQYGSWLRRLDYGNHRVGLPVDQFWLDGSLKISALEQVQFLAVLALGQLQASSKSQATVRDMIRIEDKGARVLFGKTGWDGKVGWWVGWIEEGSRITTFALNMDMTQIEDAPKRVSIGRELLARLDVY